MPGKTRPSLRSKVLYNVVNSNLSITDKKCIGEIFEKLLQVEKDEDVVKVVRCKDCKYRLSYKEFDRDTSESRWCNSCAILHEDFGDNGFCFCGERVNK